MTTRLVPDWISGWETYTDNSEPPLLFRRWVAIHMVAAMLQRKCFVDWGSLVFYPNMYIVLVAPSGKARKGTALGPALKMLSDPGRNIRMAAETTTREALIQALKEANETHIDPLTNDISFHASLTIHSQELTVFLGYRNLELLGDLTDWYDCRDRWTYRTKWSGTDDIEGVWVNLVGATTPDIIQSALPMDAIGGGLTSRMIFVFASKKGKLVPAPFLSPDDKELANALSMDLDTIGRISGQFRYTSTFLENWISWYTAQDNNPPFEDPRFAGYMERRANHAMKLSMIVNASRTDNMTMTTEDLGRAIRMLEEVEGPMRQTFAGVGRSPMAATLTKVMAEIGRKGTTTFADLMNMFQHDASKWDLEKVLDSLCASKFCIWLRNTGEITMTDNESPYAQNLNTVTKEN